MLNQAKLKLEQNRREGIPVPSKASGQDYEKWKNDLKLIVMRNLSQHPLYTELSDEVNRDDGNGWKSKAIIEKCIAKLSTIVEDEVYWNDTTTSEGSLTVYNNDVFIVHGHDNNAIIKTENFIRKMGLNPIILRDQASMHKTIIEK